jgi:hypothetical protein
LASVLPTKTNRKHEVVRVMLHLDGRVGEEGGNAIVETNWHISTFTAAALLDFDARWKN